MGSVLQAVSIAHWKGTLEVPEVPEVYQKGQGSAYALYHPSIMCPCILKSVLRWNQPEKVGGIEGVKSEV